MDAQAHDPSAGDDIDVPISAIEHFSYCPRQCALIHVEQTYDENIFTMRGSLAHERVHSGDDASTRGVRSVRSIPLWSERLHWTCSRTGSVFGKIFFGTNTRRNNDPSSIKASSVIFTRSIADTTLRF